MYTDDEGLRCTACGSVGTTYGHGLSLATAGVAATFNLISKDQYGKCFLRFRVWGLGFRVQCLGLKVWGLGYTVERFRLRFRF